MNDIEQEALGLIAQTVIDAREGRANVPADKLQRMKDILVQARPNCTDEEIANGTCKP